jgi:hypothetical protein
MQAYKVFLHLLVYGVSEHKMFMWYLAGQNNKYSVLNECNRMLNYNIFNRRIVGRFVLYAVKVV